MNQHDKHLAELKKKWSKIVAKAWADEKFKKRLISNPEEICRENGLELPSNVKFEVLQETEGKKYLLIPSKPEGHLSEGDLNNVVAGKLDVTGLPGQCLGAFL